MAPPIINSQNVQQYQEFQNQMRNKGVPEAVYNEYWNRAITQGQNVITQMGPSAGQFLGNLAGAVIPGANALINGGQQAQGQLAIKKGGFGGQIRKTPHPGELHPAVGKPRLQAGVGKSSMDSALDKILAALAASSQDTSGGGSPQYRDFSAQAQQLVQDMYGPQFNSLSGSENLARQNSGQVDQMLQGMYAKLQGDYAAQAGNVAQNYSQLGQQNTQNTQNVQNQIAQNYQGANEAQVAMLKQLGLEGTAGATLPTATGNQAWQQSQSAQLGQLQGDYLTNTGQNMQNFVNNQGGAAGMQGVYSRQNNLANLRNTLQEFANQRAALESQKRQSAFEMAQSLSDRDYNVQKDSLSNSQNAKNSQLDNMLKAYGLQVEADDRNYSRASNEAQMQQEAAIAAAKANQFDPNSVTPEANFTRQMVNTYGPEGPSYLAAAQQAVGSLDPNVANLPTFIKAVKAVAQGMGLKNQAAVLAAANYYAKMIDFKTVGQ